VAKDLEAISLRMGVGRLGLVARISPCGGLVFGGREISPFENICPAARRLAGDFCFEGRRSSGASWLV